MAFTPIIHLLQITLAVLLVVTILLQVRTQNLGGVFGGQQASVFRARRGFEKTLFQATIGLAITFILLSILSARFTGRLF